MHPTIPTKFCTLVQGTSMKKFQSIPYPTMAAMRQVWTKPYFGQRAALKVTEEKRIRAMAVWVCCLAFS